MAYTCTSCEKDCLCKNCGKRCEDSLNCQKHPFVYCITTMQQISLFDYFGIQEQKHTKLIRKNEYEMHHCMLCGYEVPDRRLVGGWPYEFVVTRECPNCHAVVDVPEKLERLAELNRRSRRNHEKRLAEG